MTVTDFVPGQEAMSYQGCDTFWTNLTELAWHELRTYEDGECSGPWGSYHNASVRLDGVFPIEKTEHGYRGEFDGVGDEEFPTVCPWCGHEFTDEAKHQTNVVRLYERADTGEYVALQGPNGEGGQGPAGMLFHSDWNPGGDFRDRYGDGINLMAVCPNGAIWHVDGPARSGGNVTTPEAWARTGDPRNPPTLTVTPSIIAGDYHGFLTAGKFTASL